MNELEKQVQLIESYVYDYSLIVDPCRLCRNKKGDDFTEKCIDCCFYYGSQFVARRIQENEVEE